MLFLISGKDSADFEDLAADYNIAYRRSGYESAGSSAHGSLTSFGMFTVDMCICVYVRLYNRTAWYVQKLYTS